MGDLFDEHLPSGQTIRYYQREAIEASLAAIAEGKNPLTIMATGTGKTVVFSNVIARRLPERALILAHRDELINQAIEKLRLWADLSAYKEKAGERAPRTGKVVVASVQSMRGARLTDWPTGHFPLIVTDEAHHAPADSYKAVVDHLMPVSHFGVTATPDRADEKELGKCFDTIAYEYPLHKGIADGYLCKIIGRQVRDFELDLSGLKITMGDYQEGALGKLVEQYIAPIATSVVKETAGRKALLFLPNVDSAVLLASALREMGVEAAALSGRDSDESRRDTLYRYKTGSITHLCSCNLFLEGYDEPSIDCIVMLRPTSSRTVYAQAVGRGTRIHPGKKELLLLEFTYNSQRLKLVSAYELFSTKGFGQRIQERAQRTAAAKDYVDFDAELEEAHKAEYSMAGLLSRAVVKAYDFVQFDPFGLADLVGTDISGEFDITWNGRALTGMATQKQVEILSRYNVKGAFALTKAQASRLIDALFASSPAMVGEITDGQLRFLKGRGYDTAGMTKAQAGVLISKLKEAEYAR